MDSLADTMDQEPPKGLSFDHLPSPRPLSSRPDSDNANSPRRSPDQTSTLSPSSSLPSALRPRPGWQNSPRNPDAAHGPIDTSAIPSSGYAAPDYTPPRSDPSPPPPPDDALTADSDALSFAAQQQGHQLGRASERNAQALSSTLPAIHNTNNAHSSSMTGSLLQHASTLPANAALSADGRPVWNDRVSLSRPAWDQAPRRITLRPPSPGNRTQGHSADNTTSNPSASPGAAHPHHHQQAWVSPTAVSSSNDPFGLPGSPSATTLPHVGPSPYTSSPKTYKMPGGGGAAARRSSATGDVGVPPRADLAHSYVGRAYSPEGHKRGSYGIDDSEMSNASLLYKDPSSAVSAGAGASGEGGGVDGHGTHLPYLEGAYGAKAGAGAGNGNGGRRARRYSDGKQGEGWLDMSLPPCCASGLPVVQPASALRPSHTVPLFSIFATLPPSHSLVNPHRRERQHRQGHAGLAGPAPGRPVHARRQWPQQPARRQEQRAGRPKTRVARRTRVGAAVPGARPLRPRRRNHHHAATGCWG